MDADKEAFLGRLMGDVGEDGAVKVSFGPHSMRSPLIMVTPRPFTTWKAALADRRGGASVWPACSIIAVKPMVGSTSRPVSGLM